MVNSNSRSNMICLSCCLDPTCTTKEKERKFSKSDLDRHIKSNFHDRDAQIQRAIKHEGRDQVSCPLCFENLQKVEFLQHLHEVHVEILWKNENDD